MTALSRQSESASPRGAGFQSANPSSNIDQAARLRYLLNAPRPQLRRVRSAKVITISSGKGGVGKTNLAVNLAIALAARHQRVTLIDLDLGLANADLLCGLNPAHRLDHALLDNASLADLAVNAPGNFTLIPGSVGLGRIADLTPDQRLEFIARLAELDDIADVIILDTGAGVGPLVRVCLRAADLAAVVATPEPTSIADAYALIKVMRQLVNRPASGTNSPAQFVPQLIINEATDAHEAQDVYTRLFSASEKFLGFPLPLLGWVPLDPAVPHAVKARVPFRLATPRCPASKAVGDISAAAFNLLSLNTPTPETPANEGFFARLSRLIAGRVD